ncbi:MAG TPA: hypothetical protein VM659_16030 [Dongiaceae bacterium]|nr:hypothetical protein [Dongiaceae bacterium]
MGKKGAFITAAFLGNLFTIIYGRIEDSLGGIFAVIPSTPITLGLLAFSVGAGICDLLSDNSVISAYVKRKFPWAIHFLRPWCEISLKPKRDNAGGESIFVHIHFWKSAENVKVRFQRAKNKAWEDGGISWSWEPDHPVLDGEQINAGEDRPFFLSKRGLTSDSPIVFFDSKEEDMRPEIRPEHRILVTVTAGRRKRVFETIVLYSTYPMSRSIDDDTLKEMAAERI